MKILALDLSTSTGWALFNKLTPISWGTLNKRSPANYKADIKSYEDYPEEYPKNFIDAARAIAQDCARLANEHNPDTIIIEEINQARSRLSQKILGFIHFAVCEELGNYDIKYLTSTCWRKLTDCYATKEDRNLNARISRHKKKRKEKLKKQLTNGEISDKDFKQKSKQPIKLDGKIVGSRNFKHHALRKVEDLLGIELKMKENDAADALLLGYAGYLAYFDEH